MLTTLISLLPGSAEKRDPQKLSRAGLCPGWHKRGGIKRSPESVELQFPGVQKCLVWHYGDRLELVRLLVKKRWRGRGVGTQVLRHLQSYGLPISVYPLSDDFRQEDLERFYQKVGFRPDPHDPETFRWHPAQPRRRTVFSHEN